jgi:FMN phosphatase YigB (HAD superfamily)
MLASAVAGNGIGDLLDAVISVDEVGAFKPDPRVYQRLIELCATAPERILVVGDRPDKDIEPARAMGLKALQIDHSGRASGADVVHDLDAVVDWVARSRQGQGVGARPTDVAGHGAGA